MRRNSINAKQLFLAAILACAVLFAADAGASAATQGKPLRLRIDSVRVGSETGPLTIRVRAGAHARLAIWVGGHRVGHPFEIANRRAQSIALRAADGLHPGLDRIRVRARHGGRAYEARRTVRMPGWALLADAGPDNASVVRAGAQVGSPAVVGGATDRAYRWRIVKRPRRGRATLAGRNQAQPMLRANSPGTYVLQLRVDPSGNGPDSFDQVTVPVVPNDPPIGAALSTFAENNSISIAGQNYGGGRCQCTSYVVLERTTRYPIESGSVLNDAKGIATITALADKYGAGTDADADAKANYLKYMMILSGTNGVPHAQIEAFAQLLKKVGVALPSAENFAALDNPYPLPYSVVGIPGAAAGAATTRIPGGYAPPVSGTIVGYLQKNQAISGDGTPLYDYVAPEHPTYDTRAESTPTSNKMVVNGVPFIAGLPGGATAGLHVVVLESMSLRPLVNVALATNNGSSDRALQKSAAEEFVKASEKPGGPLVFLQTIGKPKAAGPEWGESSSRCSGSGPTRSSSTRWTAAANTPSSAATDPKAPRPKRAPPTTAAIPTPTTLRRAWSGPWPAVAPRTSSPT